MCTAFFYFNQKNSPQSFTLIFNRDESYSRRSKPLHCWLPQKNIFAGQDIKSQGTWLGVNKKGAFAVLTNYRNPKLLKEGLESRGAIIPRFLEGSQTSFEFLEELCQDPEAYNPYNLILGNFYPKIRLYYYSNIENKIKKLEDGFYALSNALLNTPWPKVSHGLKVFENLVSGSASDEEFFTFMKNKGKANISDLPITGIESKQELLLSSLFVESKGYGTITTSLLSFDEKEHKVSFKEVNYRQNKEDKKSLSFFIKNPS
jgi:uncharacterized protein with NRDE domain